MLLRALTRTGRWLLYLFVGMLVLLAIMISAARFAAFNSGDYSERLASMVSRYVGSPVEIDHVDLVWDRFDAVASLSDVRVLSADGDKTDLILPSIQLELNLRDMLLQRNLTIRKVQLTGLSLLADYKGHGELEILGRDIRTRNNIDRQQATGEEEALAPRGRSALQWLFNAERIAILDSTITLNDRMRNKTHSIDNVDIRAFNDNDLHQIRINSSLPDAFGNTSIASFDFTGSADNMRDWSGQFYIDTRQLNLGEVSGLLEGSSVEGLVDLQAWGRWRGTRINEFRLIGAADEVDVKSLQLQSSTALSSSQVAFDLDWQRTTGGWQATFNRLGLNVESANAKRFNLNGLHLSEYRNENDVRQYRVAGPPIEIEAVHPLIEFAAAHLVKDNPLTIQQGRITDWQVIGELHDGLPQVTTANAKLVALQVESKSLTAEQLNANVFFSGNAGRIEIAEGSTINVAEPVFSNSIPAVNIGGNIHIADTSNVGDTAEWLIGSDDLKLTNNDIKIRSSFNLRLAEDGQKLLAANTAIEYINLAQAKKYLPRQGLKPTVRNWISAAILGGDVVRGQVSVNGDLSDFAPAAGRGQLFGEVDVVDSTVKFRPDWPVARQMDGNLTFNATSLRGRVYQGAMREARFSDARLLIADFKNPLLELQANAIGPLDDMLDFAQRGPLASKIGAAFGGATGIGASRMELDLTVPLKRELREQLAVDGLVLLENAQINAPRFGLDLESVTGQVRFNRQGVLINDLLVRYLGIPMRVNATQNTVAGKLVNSVQVNGPVALSSVLASFGVPVADYFDGVSNWQVKLDVTRQKPGAKAVVELSANSDQTGTMIDLPAPFYKDPDTISEARIYRNFSSPDKDWWVDLPGLAQLRIRIGADRKLESMAIALGRSNNTVLPWRGVAIHGDVGRIDALGWFQFARSLGGNKPKTNKEPFPLFANVVARSAQIHQQSVGNAVFIAFRDGDSQVHRIESPLVSGEVRVKFDASKAEPVVLRLDSLDKRLLMAFGANRDAGNVTNRPLDPRSLPPVDAIVKELKWDNWRLLRVAVRTAPAESGLEITSLTARQEDIRVSGSGQWQVSDQGVHSTNLDITASVDNLGSSVRALGGGETFADGAGESALSLTWPGPAYKPDLKSMNGTLYLSFRDGRILGVEPGAGRILGLFALQSLPRRLAFDFRDIVKTGLEYSTINGNFIIGDGKLSSQTLLFTGPVAEILIHGYSDFTERYYNQTIDVLPRVSGALPLIGVLSGGPAAGVTALVADGILKGLGVNLDEIGRRRYTLAGSWDQPQWETVDLQASR